MNRLSACIVMSIGLFFWGINSVSHAQMKSVKESCIASFRMPLPPPGFKPKLEDLNGDGKPEAIYSMTGDSVPILWIDDDRDMKWTDIEGDMDNDCLLIDRNKDGIYGGDGDLVIDWVDSDNDGKADLQIVMDYPAVHATEVWPNGHVMILLDTDKDNIFNYIDWNTYQIKSWNKSGRAAFYTDYSGQSAFTKMHVATYNMGDLRLNWENPFLFYDPDKDGLSEIAVRLLDSPSTKDEKASWNDYVNMQLEGVIDWVSISVDLDNDNAPGNDFDFDFTLGLRGGGFDYMDQVHVFKNMRGLPEADKFFMDPRWRQMDELIYPDHKNAFDLIFNRGKWESAHFVYDEDDDCHRWERVEFYEARDPFKVGAGNGGLDHNTQADAAGDRGEWDMDCSGKGNLYISPLDGRLHLYGAEWGCWRVDQNTEYYQGWDRLWINKNPKKFATVKYTDKNGNGFLDYVEYDMDGDGKFETVFDLKALGIDDRAKLIDVSSFTYRDYTKMMKRMSDGIWERAQTAVRVAHKYGLNTSWYAWWIEALSMREKYHRGYWLQYYLFQDLMNYGLRTGDKDLQQKLVVAYCSGNWKSLL
ncbi:hypothetical protein [Coprobacter fastidiosus]|uniref:Uncharacterized protein n=5 Tax=Coprobacter TaxID=1348911 RepID=A0A495VL85_9BACT|nr:hypothetical protein BC742_2194 [Coprobacter fastidiosus NSB1 = JCM 33896]BEG61896.1 hypothetical protein Cfast33896_08510 [Coprobacter fastidiosus]